MRNSKAQSGFTLVEMLVALVLLSMIAMVGYQGVVFGMTQWQGGEKKLSAITDRYQALSWIRNRLAAAERITYPENGRYPIAFTGNADSVRFVSRFGRARRGGLYVCELALDKDNSQLQVAYGLYHPENGSYSRQKSRSQTVVMEGVSNSSFRYYGDTGGQGRHWHDSWKSNSRLPELVEMVVTDSTGSKSSSVIYIETADRL